VNCTYIRMHGATIKKKKLFGCLQTFRISVFYQEDVFIITKCCFVLLYLGLYRMFVSD